MCVGPDAARRLQGREQPINTDGDPGGWHLLTREALDQIVIAIATSDRAELHGLALFVLDVKGQLRLIDGAGVVAQAAHDRGIDDDAVGTVALR